ncbi:MAG: beta-ketoacyl-[acyl-carrier-protein] synthase family protein [Polyangia bacterium]
MTGPHGPRRVAVTGLGAVCGLGLDVEALWRGLCEGKSAVRRYPALQRLGLDLGPIAKVALPEDVAGPPATSGEPGDGADDGGALLGGRPRGAAFALRAAAEALEDAGLDPGAVRLGLSVGTTLGDKGPWVQGLRAAWGQLPAGAPASAPASASDSAVGIPVTAPAQAVARRYRAALLRVVSTACASGNAALGVAMQWVRSGACDVVLCGGVDALQEFVLSGFHSLRAHSREPARPFDAARSGLNLGEGAAFLVVEAAEHAAARGRRVRAFLDGYGLSCDAHHMTGPDRNGRGAARAMLQAIADAALAPEAIDFVSTHGTATVFNDLMEARGLEAVLGGRGDRVPVNSIKGALGHTLGAAGALEAVMAVRALEEQCIPPTTGHHERDPQIHLDVVAGGVRRAPLRTVLSTSSGFGGVNAALVLQAGEPAPTGAERP